MWSFRKISWFSIFLFSMPAIFSTNLEKGVNYDPTHSFDYAKAVGTDDVAGMQSAMEKDLDKLAGLQNTFPEITHIKTFFTVFSSSGVVAGQPIPLNFSDVVHVWNQKNPQHAIKAALGIYEFRVGVDACKAEADCRAWTKAQVDGAVKAVNQYGADLVDRVIVGNEDLDTNESKAAVNMANRIKNDIDYIKQNTKGVVPVGTAQTATTASSMVQQQSGGVNGGVYASADFIGTNEYPYWGGVAYVDAKTTFARYWNDLVASNTGNKPLIETEEGWPSAGYVVGNARPNATNAHDYLYYWYYRDDQESLPHVSYYFALFDKLPGQGTESHWGIYSADRASSLLQGDGSKSLAPGHEIVTVDNKLNKTIAVLACLGDYNSHTNSQGQCYPIYGDLGSGDVNYKKEREFMVDATGQTYKSLMLIYQGATNTWLRLCYISNAVLEGLRTDDAILATWLDDAGDQPCPIQ